MRVVVDTNILISALFNRSSPAGGLVDAWEERRFDLLTCEEQLEEFSRVTRYPKIRERISPADAGTLKNQLRGLALVVEVLPRLDISPDPADNWMLGLAQAGKADYLTSGDKRDIVHLGKYRHTRVVTLAEMLNVLKP